MAKIEKNNFFFYYFGLVKFGKTAKNALRVLLTHCFIGKTSVFNQN
jgi:hypothetical protein